MQFHPIFGKRQKGDVVLEGGQDIWRYFKVQRVTKVRTLKNEPFSHQTSHEEMFLEMKSFVSIIF